MAKAYVRIGYAEQYEASTDVWKEQIITRGYYCNIIRNVRKNENGSSLNDDLALNNQISIIADPYAIENFSIIRFVSWMGMYWKVTNVEVQFPRLILTVGGAYNGPK